MKKSYDESLFWHAVKDSLEPDQIKRDPETFSAYLTEPRGVYEGLPSGLILPRTTEQVSHIMACAWKYSMPVVIQGGNTGLMGGQIPDCSGQEILLSLTQMDAVGIPCCMNNALDVQAGVTLARVQEVAQSADRLFPLSLASQDSCTIGGNLATNAGGMSVMTYGSMRHLTLGIEVVLADGRIWSGQSSLTKDNTGYALKDLFIGSEGTLGIITAATLKLFPNPPYTVTAWLGIASLEMGLQLLTRAKSLAGCHVFACELMSENGLELVSAYDPHLQSPLSSPWHILLELRGGDETFLHNALERIVCAMQEEGLTVLLASSHEQRARFWRIRERMSEAQKIRGRAIKFDLSVPLSELPKFLEDATEQAQRLISDCFVVAFGHLGDGSIHFDVCPSRAPDGQAKLLALEPVLTDALINRVQRIHGSMAAEHGIGRRKRDLLKRIKDPVALEMMRALKNALDPKGILNPGVML